MINSHNIQKYISFLYEKKTGKQIPNETLESWTGLDDVEVAEHLNAMYSNWKVTINDAKAYENEFIAKGARPKPVIPIIDEPQPEPHFSPKPEPVLVQQTNPDPYPTEKKNFKVYWLAISGLALVIIATVFVLTMDNEDNIITSTPAPAMPQSYTPQPYTQQPAYDNRTYENVSSSASSGATSVRVLGTVSISTDGTFGTRTSNGIERRLRKEAKRLYGTASITNIRYEGNAAFADVIR